LNETLLIGDVSQLDYTRVTDKIAKPSQSLLSQNTDLEDSLEPQLLYTKFQRLKNSATKLARVLIVDETPVRGQSE
jgi:hypothetical protein